MNKTKNCDGLNYRPEEDADLRQEARRILDETDWNLLFETDVWNPDPICSAGLDGEDAYQLSEPWHRLFHEMEPIVGMNVTVGIAPGMHDNKGRVRSSIHLAKMVLRLVSEVETPIRRLVRETFGLRRFY